MEQCVALLTVLAVQVFTKVIEDLSKESGQGWLVPQGCHLQHIRLDALATLGDAFAYLQAKERTLRVIRCKEVSGKRDGNIVLVVL